MELKNLGQTAGSALIHTDIRLEREHWTMFRNKTLGIAAAATLGIAAMLGTTAANAIKIFDSAPATRAAVEAGVDSFTYATETLLTSAVTEVKGDSTKYYNVGGTGTVVLSAPADVGANVDDIYVVAVTLDGMVLRSIPTLALVAGTGIGSPAFNVATGGAVGAKTVVFRMTAGAIDASASVFNMTASFAVSEGGGSATLTMTNQTLAGLNLEGVSGRKEHRGNVIKVAPALKETAMANDLTASVESSFKKLMGGMTVGHVGFLTVGFNAHRIATDGDGTTNVAGLEDILVTGQTTVGSTTTAASSVSFMGDFSFTEKVFVHGDSDCGAPDSTDPTQSAGADSDLASAEGDIRMMEGEGDAATVTNTTKSVNLDATPTDDSDALTGFTGYLCIMVQGDDADDMEAPRIPDTGAYTAMGSYMALDMAAMGPMGMERALGEINRDGTTIRIPFVTTSEGYNQRIVLVNRGPETRYEINFTPEDGTMVDPEMMEGMLPKGTTMMRAQDVVTITGATARTAATIIVEALPSMIDAATVTINKGDGSSDTVVYD